MKILHVNKFYFPKRGADRYFFDLSKLLIDHGHHVVPFSMAHPKNLKTMYREYFVSQVNFSHPSTFREKMRAAGRMMYSIEARNKIIQLASNEKCDIVHIENIYHQISPSILPVLKKRFQLPIVQTVHDYKLLCPNYRMFTKDAVCERCHKTKFYNAVKYTCMQNSYSASCALAMEMYFHAAMGFYKKHVDLFIAPSKFMKRKMMEWGMDEKKINVLRNFVDTSYFEPSQTDGGYFLYAGGLEPEKGIMTLLRAVKKSPKFRVKIAGDGTLRTYVEQFIRDYKLRSQVELIGYAERDQLKKLIQMSRAVVVPSEWYENNPLIILEAFACGKPVIGSQIGGIPELIGDNERGILFPAQDHLLLSKAMDQLIMDQRESARRGINARVFAEQQSKEQYYTSIIQLYHALLEGKKTGKLDK